MNSRGAATECSPGRKPGLHSVAAPRLNTDAGTSLTTLNASTGVAGDDGIPHCAGSPHNSLDIGGEHEPLAHQIARSPLHAIQVVLFARVALGDREPRIAGLLSFLRGFGEWLEGTDEACQIFETSQLRQIDVPPGVRSNRHSHFGNPYAQ